MSGTATRRCLRCRRDINHRGPTAQYCGRRCQLAHWREGHVVQPQLEERRPHALTARFSASEMEALEFLAADDGVRPAQLIRTIVVDYLRSA